MERFMTTLKEGMKAPDFKLPADDGTILSLKDYRGQKLVLYFYPKDDTPGCTTEACAFNDGLQAFKKLNAAVLGVSKDSTVKHRKFREKYSLNFPLLSDEDGTMLARYGVWVEKSMYGKKYMGIERATFLIDEEGRIEKIWHKVKVTGHAEEILNALSS